MGPVGVVVGHPGVELGLGSSEVGEHPAGQELGAQGAVETLDLAGRGRRAGRGEPMGDAVLPADLVEQHLGLRPAEPAGEHLAVVGEDLLGHPVAAQGLRRRTPHTGRAVARTMTRAQTQNREWSSTPVSTLHSVPSASSTPPTTSICHNSIGRPRSHRL